MPHPRILCCARRRLAERIAATAFVIAFPIFAAVIMRRHSYSWSRDWFITLMVGSNYIIAVISLLKSLVVRTVFTDRGVEHRTWYGRTRFTPNSELCVLNGMNDSILIIAHDDEIRLDRSTTELTTASELLRRNAQSYLIIE